MTLLIRVFWVASLLATTVAAGCGGSNYQPAEPPKVDEAQAELAAALDAWKAGDTLESLKQHNPPIYMSDHDWSANRKLTEYTIQGSPQLHGNNVRFAVVLTVRGASGGPKKIAAVYLVNTRPEISVVRTDIAE